MTTGQVSNLKNSRIGTWTAIEPTGQTERYTATRVWTIRCDCGRERLLCVSDFRQYQRRGKAPRCACQTEHAKRRPPRPMKPSIVSPPRVPSKMCFLCASIPWRVEGIKCRECGIRFEHEAPVTLVTDSLASSAGMALDFAVGGME